MQEIDIKIERRFEENDNRQNTRLQEIADQCKQNLQEFLEWFDIKVSSLEEKIENMIQRFEGHAQQIETEVNDLSLQVGTIQSELLKNKKTI